MSRDITAQEKMLENFIESMNNEFKEVLGYQWYVSWNVRVPVSERTYLLYRGVPAAFGFEHFANVIRGSYSEVMAYLEPYCEGLRVGVKSMAGAPERAAKLYTRQYSIDAEEEYGDGGEEEDNDEE